MGGSAISQSQVSTQENIQLTKLTRYDQLINFKILVYQHEERIIETNPNLNAINAFFNQKYDTFRIIRCTAVHQIEKYGENLENYGLVILNAKKLPDFLKITNHIHFKFVVYFSDPTLLSGGQQFNRNKSLWSHYGHKFKGVYNQTEHKQILEELQIAERFLTTHSNIYQLNHWKYIYYYFSLIKDKENHSQQITDFKQGLEIINTSFKEDQLTQKEYFTFFIHNYGRFIQEKSLISQILEQQNLVLLQQIIKVCEKTTNPQILGYFRYFIEQASTYIHEEYTRKYRNKSIALLCFKNNQYIERKNFRQFYIVMQLSSFEIKKLKNQENYNFMFPSFVVGFINREQANQQKKLMLKKYHLNNIYVLSVTTRHQISQLDEETDRGYIIRNSKIIFNQLNFFKMTSFNEQERFIEATYGELAHQVYSRGRLHLRQWSRNLHWTSPYDSQLATYHCAFETTKSIIKSFNDLLLLLCYTQASQSIIETRISITNTKLRQTGTISAIQSSQLQKMYQILGDIYCQQKDVQNSLKQYQFMDHSDKRMLKISKMYLHCEKDQEFKKTYRDFDIEFKKRLEKGLDRMLYVTFLYLKGSFEMKENRFKQSSQTFQNALRTYSLSVSEERQYELPFRYEIEHQKRLCESIEKSNNVEEDSIFYKDYRNYEGLNKFFIST